MKNLKFTLYRVIPMAFIFVVLFPKEAMAYIDPATSSYVIQLISGAVIACGVILKIYWKKVTSFFKNIKIKSMEAKIKKEANKK